MSKGKCGYAYPGTYGHECGKPATWAQQLPAPEFYMRFWALRCDDCRDARGPDNAGLRPDAWIPYSAEMTNQFLRNRWPSEPEVVTVPA